VTYDDSTGGSPLITGSYSGDSNNGVSSGQFTVAVESIPAQVLTAAPECEYTVSCHTSFLQFNVTSSGHQVDANVTLVAFLGPTQIGTTMMGSSGQLASYPILAHDTITYTVTLPDGQYVSGVIRNTDPWTTVTVVVTG
jgi:hypothetical protein